MLKRANSIKMNKRGLSEIVAYAIMIAIAISLSVAVYAWLRPLVDSKPAVDCKEGTSVYLESYSCPAPGNTIILTIKNNGGFNVTGVIVKVSDDVAKEPTVALTPDDITGVNTAPGYYQFSSELQPGESDNAVFTKMVGGSVISVKRVSYQAFIFANNKKVVCSGTAMKPPIDGC